MWGSSRSCSHILSVLGEGGPKERGNLYLSGVYSLQEPLKDQLGINCVLTIIDHWAYKNFKVEQRVEHLAIENHKWMELDDLDDEDIFPFLEEAHAYIKDNLQHHNVLVHCQMGISRSSSLVIAFLMKEFSMSFLQAKALVKSKRAIIDPNEGFQKHLLKFEGNLKAQPQPVQA